MDIVYYRGGKAGQFRDTMRAKEDAAIIVFQDDP
jgi:hypothetical protein